MIGSALERRVWTWTKIKEPTYNNLFVMLLCEPGGGKSQILSPVKDILEATKRHTLAPSGITREALLDFMQVNSKRSIVYPPQVVDECASVLCIAPEFGNFIREHNLNQMSTLNELWDCPTSYKDYTRTSNSVDLSYPFLSFITGAQPQFLAASLPDAAYGMGFMARTILVYSDQIIKEDIFSLDDDMSSSMINPLREDLIHDLRIISDLIGEMKWTREAKHDINEWIKKDCPPLPEHAKLQHYNKRRVNMLIRISSVMSISCSGELVVTIEDVNKARDLMIETEGKMVQGFAAISSRGYDIALEEAFDYVWDRYLNSGKEPISEQRLVHTLQSKIPINQIQYAIKTMLHGGMIKKTVASADTEGKRTFIPVPRAQHGGGE